MKKSFNSLVVLAILCGLNITAAQPMVIKLGTLAPSGSELFTLMVEMGQRWEKDTGGAVKLRIYPNGVVGDERDMIRKIRIGQIHAAAVSTEGLSVITPQSNAFIIPLLMDNYEDVDWIRAHLEEELKAEYLKNGFVVLNWGDVGWAYWFTRKPIRTPQDLKSMRIFTWAGDFKAAELWKNAGFQSVQLAYLDVLSGMQTGLIDAIATPAILALSNQIFGPAPYMLDMKWGLVTGGTIIDKRIWNKITPENQARMLKIAAEMGVKQQLLNRSSDTVAVNTMLKYGLTVIEPTPAEKQEWLVLTRSFYPLIRDNLVPAGIFDRMITLKARRDSLRLAGHPDR